MSLNLAWRLAENFAWAIEEIRENFEDEKASDSFINEMILRDYQGRGVIVQAENGQFDLSAAAIETVEKLDRKHLAYPAPEFWFTVAEKGAAAWLDFGCQIYRRHYPEDQASDLFVAVAIALEMTLTRELDAEFDRGPRRVLRLARPFPNEAAFHRLQSIAVL